MPVTVLKFYRDASGSVPLLEWLSSLARTNVRAYKKCVWLLERLAEEGRELRRPLADYLRDGIYELRTQVGNVNYRILYGFVGQNVVLLTSGLTKERSVPPAEIETAIARIADYQRDPKRFGHIEEA
jgi:hypothetical protein